jgi:hypothetical protein
MYPSRDRGHPSGLMALGKQALGCALCPGGLWPCGLLDTRKQAHGGTLSPVADTPWALMVPRKRREGCIARGKGLRPSGRIDSRERGEGAPLRGLARGMRPHRRADEPEGSRDRRRGPLPSGSSLPLSTGEPCAIAPKGDSLRAPGVGVGREGRPLSGEGDGLHAALTASHGPGHRPSRSAARSRAPTDRRRGTRGPSLPRSCCRRRSWRAPERSSTSRCRPRGRP